MNRETILARALGLWLSFQAAAQPFLGYRGPLLVGAGIVGVSTVFWLLDPWIAFPLLVSVGTISWAIFAPQNCKTWFGWIGLLFRMIGALTLTSLAWAISAVLQ